ncbi:MAG: Mini-ribonuclease 3 [Lachnospiraceae bacterium]|jgi:ribonuclease-3 family protein|nr:Mini-ribonuclease 3 [Lachnospiraceae bacterium]
MAQGITDPIQYSPLVLAYMGDAYYELFIRNMLVDQANEQVEKLHKKTISYVKASAQAAIIDHYIDAEMLTEEEMAVFKRGRNTKSHTIPKNAVPSEYRKATGFEALIGFLYLKGDTERTEELIKAGVRFLDEKKQ